MFRDLGEFDSNPNGIFEAPIFKYTNTYLLADCRRNGSAPANRIELTICTEIGLSCCLFPTEIKLLEHWCSVHYWWNNTTGLWASCY